MNNGKYNMAVAVGVIVLMAAAGGVYFKTKASPSPVAAPTQPALPETVETRPALTAAPSPTLPNLEESDDWARKNAAGLSADPRFPSWLAVSDVLSRWVGAVNIVAAGRVPVDGLSFLRPRRKFKVVEKGGRVLIDPRSFERYNVFAEVFASLNTAAVAQFFRLARPLIDAAWSNLGENRGGILDGVARAAAELLAAPTVDASAPLRPCEKAINYCYVDENLEQRSLAQKQLMRMGPRNQGLIQAKIRDLTRVLGVPNR